MFYFVQALCIPLLLFLPLPRQLLQRYVFLCLAYSSYRLVACYHSRSRAQLRSISRVQFPLAVSVKQLLSDEDLAFLFQSNVDDLVSKRSGIPQNTCLLIYKKCVFPLLYTSLLSNRDNKPHDREHCTHQRKCYGLAERDHCCRHHNRVCPPLDVETTLEERVMMRIEREVMRIDRIQDAQQREIDSLGRESCISKHPFPSSRSV
jgi:hypothetical protein